MISFKEGNLRFHYRTAGVALWEGRVLLHRMEPDTFWSLPGGRVEFREAAPQALEREMREELGGLQIRVGRLLWIAENFFTYAGEQHQEIGLYFLMEFAPDAPLYCRDAVIEGWEGSHRLTFCWFPQELQTLTRLPVYPAFLQQGLTALPEVPTHVINPAIDSVLR